MQHSSKNVRPWACGRCGTDRNHITRYKCRRCGARAPDKVCEFVESLRDAKGKGSNQGNGSPHSPTRSAQAGKAGATATAATNAAPRANSGRQDKTKREGSEEASLRKQLQEMQERLAQYETTSEREDEEMGEDNQNEDQAVGLGVQKLLAIIADVEEARRT